MQIHNIKIESRDKCFLIYIEFTIDKPKDMIYFGTLNKYHPAVFIESISEYEAYLDKLELEGITSSSNSRPHKKGFLLGSDKITPYGKDKFYYKEYISKNKVTLACLDELREFKEKLDSKEEASFRSTAVQDFGCLLQTLDMYWD